MANYQRIATEEAFSTAELYQHYRGLLKQGSHNDPGFESLWGFYLTNTNARIAAVTERMLDLGARRIKDMDDTGVALQILAVTAPGVQVFDKDRAVRLARSTNDQLAEAIGK